MVKGSLLAAATALVVIPGARGGGSTSGGELPVGTERRGEV